jgi:RNA polymerase sigma-70 factor (ECF subfamily)
LDEATLISRALAGDASAWEPVILAHQEAVFRLAYLLLGDPDEARDVAQDTFVRAWRGIHRYDRSRPLRPWLLRICGNLASNRRRSFTRHVAALLRGASTEPPQAGMEELSVRHIEAEQLWKAVRCLELADQQMIYLRYFLDLSVAETAETLQTAQGTVKSRSSRALERLRNVIARDFPMLGDERST